MTSSPAQPGARSNHPRLLLRSLLGACCLLAALPAAAATFCVDNGTELRDAIGIAAINDEDDEIRIFAGRIPKPYGYENEYDYIRPIWSYRPIESDLDKSLTISGGWQPAQTCDVQVGQPADTVIDAGTYGSAFYIRAKPSFEIGADQTLRGAVVLRNFTIENSIADRNDNPSDPGADAAAIQYVGLTQGASLTIERVVVHSAQIIGASNSVISVHTHGSGSFRLIGNTIHDNRLYGDAGASAVRMICEGGALCYANNNSIHDNLTPSNPLLPVFALGGIVNAANNVVADNNTGSPGSISPAQAGPIGAENGLDLRNNHFQNELFVAPYNMTANTYGNAYWTLVGLHRIPDLDSHLRNSGRNNPLGGNGSLDIVGNPRVREGTVDRGAYERINVPPALGAPGSVIVSTLLGANAAAYFTSVTDADGSAQALVYTLSFVSCTPTAAPDLLYMGGDGSVRLSGAVPAGVTACFVVAKVSDGGLSTEASTTVTFNRPPNLGDAQITLPIGTATGTIVHTFAATDDGVPTNTRAYSLLGFMGPSNPFTLSGNGNLILAQALPSQATSYTLSVKACDAMPLCDNGVLVIDTVPGGGAMFRDGFEN